jgi:UDP-N-acetylglucosamine 2-epimerase (non-hydrolysing)
MPDRIAIIVGTRPEAIKLVPVYLELNKRTLHVDLISTGQHEQMLQQIFDFFSLSPDIHLKVMQPNQTLSGLTALLIDKLQQCIDVGKYDMLIVQGDTTTAFVGALVGFYNKIPVYHIEAGLRTYDRNSPFPEEINRQLITRLATFHFAPTVRALKNLQLEGVENAHMVGNTVIDSLLMCIDRIKMHSDAYKEKYKILDDYDSIILITGHRRENFGKGFESICEAIRALAVQYPATLFYYPVHLNPNVRNVVLNHLGGVKNVVLDEPISYDELIYVMSRSKLILTDSGGIQEEGPTLNKPILVMRDTTERPEGIDAGCSKLVGTSTDVIIEEFTKLMGNPAYYQSMANIENPYGDGSSSRKIADIILGQSVGNG